MWQSSRVDVWWNLTIGVVALCICEFCHAQSGGPQQIASSQPPILRPELLKLLPDKATLIQESNVDFQDDGGVDIVVTYSTPDKQYPVLFTLGLRVFGQSRTSGWTLTYEEAFERSGANDTVTLENVRSTSGKEGVVVIHQVSGAGTATDWHILASAKHRLFKLDPTRIRNKVLTNRGYVDNGYNGVTSKGALVIEELPGYSLHQARCCPNRPSISMTFKFTGSSVRLDTVSKLPFSPIKD